MGSNGVYGGHLQVVVHLIRQKTLLTNREEGCNNGFISKNLSTFLHGLGTKGIPSNICPGYEMHECMDICGCFFIGTLFLFAGK